MKCTKCQGEWFHPQNVSLSKCPFCQTDLLPSLHEQTDELSAEAILQNMLQVNGIELVQQEQLLAAMIADLFSHDKRTHKMLQLSIKEQVPKQLLAIPQNSEREVGINMLKQHLIDEVYINHETATQIINLWESAFGIKKPVNSFEIVLEEGCRGFRNSKEDIMDLNLENKKSIYHVLFKIVFSDGKLVHDESIFLSSIIKKFNLSESDVYESLSKKFNDVLKNLSMMDTSQIQFFEAIVNELVEIGENSQFKKNISSTIINQLKLSI